MNKVAIVTKAKLFEKEEFYDVFSSVKVAEKYLRTNVSQYLKKDAEESYHADINGETILFFIRMNEVKDK